MRSHLGAYVSYGFEAEVLQPPELREAAALLARRLAAMAGTG